MGPWLIIIKGPSQRMRAVAGVADAVAYRARAAQPQRQASKRVDMIVSFEGGRGAAVIGHMGSTPLYQQ
jgi:hypothetical protein